MSERVYKIRLILHYAKIRLRRFWKEWGISRHEAADLAASVLIILFLLSLSVVGTIFI